MKNAVIPANNGASQFAKQIATWTSSTPPFALLTSLSVFPLPLKRRKKGKKTLYNKFQCEASL
jgi:hypothetical protein